MLNLAGTIFLRFQKPEHIITTKTNHLSQHFFYNSYIFET